jgi:hypothetical protein
MRRPSPLPTLDRQTIFTRRSPLVSWVIEVGAIASALTLCAANFMEAQAEAKQVRAPERHGTSSQPPTR